MKQNLVAAAKSGDIIQVKRLIEQSADLNLSTHLGTPIECASKKGEKEIVKLLIEAEADINAPSLSGTPLTVAIENQHDEIALLLIQAGANPKLVARLTQVPPIVIAAIYSSREVIEALVKAGADVDVVTRQVTLNQAMIRQQAVEALQSTFELLETTGKTITQLEDNSDNDPKKIDKAVESFEIAAKKAKLSNSNLEQTQYAVDVTPIIIAARCGNTDAIQALLIAGANPHLKDGEGLCAYEWAVINEHPQILSILRKAGITGAITTLEEQLINAVEKGDVSLVKELIEQGADINTADRRRKTKDYTPQGHLDVVKILLSANADPNQSDRAEKDLGDISSLLEHTSLATVASMGNDFGKTPLIVAAQKGHLEILQKLIAAETEVNHQDALGYTALFFACKTENLAITQELIDASADVNLHNLAQESVLLTPSAKCNLPLIKLLIDNKIDVNALSNDGESALGNVAGATQTVSVNDSDPQQGEREYRDGGVFEERSLPETQILEAIDLLFQAGVDPNLPNTYMTPLGAAAIQGYVRVIQYLLDVGTKVRFAKDFDNALDLADLYDQHETLELLKQNIGEQKWVSWEDKEDECDNSEERWGEEFPRPDFTKEAQATQYQVAVQELGKLCGSKPVLVDDDFPGYFEIHVLTAKIPEINTEKIQQQFLNKGYFVYEPGNYSFKGMKRLAIIPTDDKYQAISFHQTNGCNYSVGPGYIIEWLKQLEIEQPFLLTSITHDSLGGRFLNPIQDPEKLAEEMYERCSDIVEQGCGSVEILAKQLRENNKLYFWWD